MEICLGELEISCREGHTELRFVEWQTKLEETEEEHSRKAKCVQVKRAE